MASVACSQPLCRNANRSIAGGPTEIMDRLCVCGSASREKLSFWRAATSRLPRALVEESDSSDWFIKFSRYGGHV